MIDLSGVLSPTLIVISAPDVSSVGIPGSIARLRERLGADPDFRLAGEETNQVGAWHFSRSSAVILDAIVVRIVLVPASMALLGERNWYLPGWLRWLPRLEVEHDLDTSASPLPGMARPT